MPAYDEALLRRELQLFPEWYVQRYLGHALSEAQQGAWERICRLLIDRPWRNHGFWCIATTCRAT